MLNWRTILAAVVAIASAAAQEFTGDGTGYVLDTPSSGNCNFMNVPKAVSTNYVALATERFARTAACGKCIQVRCTDDKCKGATASEVLYVVDQCPGCAKDDLDFSREVFMKLTNGIEPGRLKMTWSFVTCPHTSDIVMCKKPGSSGFWLAVQPAGAVIGVSSVKINGKSTSMVDSAFYFKLESSPGIDLSKVQFELSPDNGGDSIKTTLDMTKDGCVPTGKQFGRSGGAPAPPPSDAPPSSTKAPVTTVAATPEPTTTAPAPTTFAPTPEVTTAEVTTVSPSVSESTTVPVATTSQLDVEANSPTAPSSNLPTSSPASVEISVQAQSENHGLDLGYYLILAGGCVMAGVALAVIVHIRRKKWEEKDSDLDFNDAQTAVAARRSDDSIAIL